jgi:hypothetical protein
MASHDPSKYRFPTPVYVIMFVTLLTAYYMYVPLHLYLLNYLKAVMQI